MEIMNALCKYCIMKSVREKEKEESEKAKKE